MLHVSAKYYRTDRCSFEFEQLGSDNRLIGEALEIAKTTNNLLEISSLPGGAFGHKRWMSIIKDRLILYAYFVDGIVDFEFFSTPETEGCGYCSGEMSLDSLEIVLTRIDDGLFRLSDLKANVYQIDFSPRHG